MQFTTQLTRLKKKSNSKQLELGKSLLLTVSIAIYVVAMGKASDRASAIAINDFSINAIKSWSNVSGLLNISPANTQEGSLSPYTSANVSALDSVVYGHHVLNDDYKVLIKANEMPGLINELYTYTYGDKSFYSAGGLNIEGIKDHGDGFGSVMFSGASLTLTDTLNRLFDQKNIHTSRDTQGSVQYQQQFNGRYSIAVVYPYKNR